MSFSGRSGKRVALIRQLEAWKLAKQNPMDEDGHPAPLRALALRVMGDGSGQVVQQWPCDAKMEHVTRADEILNFCEHYANEVSISGEVIVFALYPFFGAGSSGGRIEGAVYPIQIAPQPKFEGPDRFAASMDLRNPSNQSSTVLREAVGLTRESWALVGGTMRITVESLERQVERLTAENQALKTDRERLWEMQQKLMDHQLDREIRFRKENVQIAAMEAAAGKLLSYLPVVTSKLDQFVAEKFGVASGTPSEEADRLRGALHTILSKFSDKDKASKIFTAMELSESELAVIKNIGGEFLMEEKHKKLQEEARAATRGLPGVVPIRRLPGMGGSGMGGEG
jgi:hypothetical protein